MPKPLCGVRADSPRSYRGLEQVAAYVRQQLKLSPEEAIKPLQLFESLDDIRIERASGKAIPLWHGVIALEDSEGYTRYDSERGLIEVLASEQTYEWLEQGHSRATFFVPHELGHCLLHTEQLIRLAQMPTRQLAALHRGTAEHRAFEDTEWQANAFACALLMPADGLSGGAWPAGTSRPLLRLHRASRSRFPASCSAPDGKRRQTDHACCRVPPCTFARTGSTRFRRDRPRATL